MNLFADVKSQNTFMRHSDFISSCVAISLGMFLGFMGARFLQHLVNSKVLENCEVTRIVKTDDFLIGARLFCLSK